AEHGAAVLGQRRHHATFLPAVLASPQASKKRLRLKRGFSAWHTFAKRDTSCAASASSTEGHTRRQSRMAAARLLKCLLLIGSLSLRRRRSWLRRFTGRSTEHASAEARESDAFTVLACYRP